MWFILFAIGASIFSVVGLIYLTQSERVAEIKRGPFLVEWQLSDAEFKAWQGYRRRDIVSRAKLLLAWLPLVYFISFINSEDRDIGDGFLGFCLSIGLLFLLVYLAVRETIIVPKADRHRVLISHQGAVVGAQVYAFNQDSVWKRTVVLETEEIEGQLWSKLVFTVNDTGRKNGKYTLELPVPVDKQKEAEYVAAMLTLEPQVEEV